MTESASFVEMGVSRRLEQVVCTRCGCLCDDIRLDVRDGAIVGADRACPLGSEWLLWPRELVPRSFVACREVALKAALDEAARLIAASDAPLLVGLAGISLEAARESLELADACRMAVLPIPELSAADARAGIDAPEFTASLGAVRATADLVIFWRADPLSTHPRHLERYSLEPPLIAGRSRQLVVVDDAAGLAGNATAAQAAATIALAAAGEGFRPDVDVALQLRLIFEKQSELRGAPPDAAAVELARRIESARHTHIFLGIAAGQDAGIRDTLHHLAAGIRQRLHVTVSTLSGPGNESGVRELLTWRCGTPGPIAPLDRKNEIGIVETNPPAATDKQPAWLPGVLTIDSLRTGALCDLLLVVGATRPGDETSPPIDAGEVTRIVIDARPDPGAAVSIVVPGLDPRLRGTIVRGDGIALSLCGNPAQGVEDPLVAILADLRNRVAFAEAAR